MKKPENNKNQIQLNTELTENLVSLLGQLVGVNVTPTREVQKISEIKEKLEQEVDSLVELNQKYVQIICKLQPYINYRGKWRELTKSIEVKTRKLNKQRLEIPNNISPEMHKNLSEAFQCYVLDLKMASYIMILRSVEIGINELYDKHNPPRFDESKGKFVFENAKSKLNWIEKNKYLKGANYRIAKSFIEGRNEAVHEIYEPSDLQIFSAIEIVLDLIKLMTQQENNNS